MEGAFREQIEELYRCRSDYSTLFQNFKQARVIFEDKEQADSAQLQVALKKIEMLERKVDSQKRTIAIQKSARGGFENDVTQLKYASEALEKREKCILDKHELISAQNNELKNEVKVQSDIIYRQLADIEKLKSIVSNETVPKIDLERRCSELNSMKLTMQEDMVTLHTHQQVKEKYADLQCRAEWSMISLEEYNKVIVEVESLKAKLEGCVPRYDFTILNQKLQTVIAETQVASDSLKSIAEARDDAFLSASEWKEKHITLEEDTERTERDLIASRIREGVAIQQVDKLRSVFESIDYGRKESYENTVRLETANSTLTLQLEGVKQQLEREAISTARLQDTIKTMKDNFGKESITLQVELESLRSSLMLEAERYSARFESELLKSASKVDRVTSQHLGELEALHDRFNEQLFGLYADRDAAREALEARHEEQVEAMREGERNRLAALTLSNQVSEAAVVEKYDTFIEQIKNEHFNEITAFAAERQECLESSLRDLQGKHHEEIVCLQRIHESRNAALQEQCKSLQDQQRKEEIKKDLERIRADAAEAELASERRMVAEREEREKEEERENEREKEDAKGREEEKERKRENRIEAQLIKDVEKENTRKESEKNETERKENERKENETKGNEMKEDERREVLRIGQESERGAEREREEKLREDEKEREEKERAKEREAVFVRAVEVAVERERALEKEREKKKDEEKEKGIQKEKEREREKEKEKEKENGEIDVMKSPLLDVGDDVRDDVRGIIEERNAQNRSIEKLLLLREEIGSRERGKEGGESGSRERDSIHGSRESKERWERGSIDRSRDSREGRNSSESRERRFEDDSQLIEITRSLEGCSFSQLVHIAAKGMMKESLSSYRESPFDDRSSFIERSPVFMPPFGSPGGLGAIGGIGGSGGLGSMATPSRGHFAVASPSYLALQQVRDAVVRSSYSGEPDRRQWGGSEGGVDISSDRGERGERNGDKNSDRSGDKGVDRNGERNGERSGDRRRSPNGRISPGIKREQADLSWMDTHNARGLPYPSSSPPATPIQPYRRQTGVTTGGRPIPSASIIGASILGVSINGTEELRGEQRGRSADKRHIPSIPSSVSLASVPPSPSRDELLDRLISLSKEARGKGAGTMGFLYAQPL